MHRFRKRSDAKRVQVPPSLRETHPTEPLPPLPPASDFRTSLILPDLTRRFSVLRNSSGEPISVDDLKSRFEAQRARGSQNRVSESEEDMILEALSRLRTNNGRQKVDSGGGTDGTGSNLMSTYSDDLDNLSRNSVSPSLVGGQSVRSTTTTSSALHGSASIASLSSAKGRRMSNNLFGSNKFRDNTYIRTAHHRRPAPSSSTRTSSVKHSDSATSMSTVTSSRAGNNNSMYSDNQSLRPVTPEGSAYTNSVPSSPNKPLSTRDEIPDPIVDVSPDLTKTLSPDVLGRASLALDEVIREIEEEADDEIVMERSPISIVPNNYTSLSSPAAEPSPSSTSSPTSPGDEAGMALSSDDQFVDDEIQPTSPYPRSRTTSPTPRLPGYIPGMPRPMTPHETTFDSDDQTPSATPRATSPRLPGVSPQVPALITQNFSSGMYRSNSTTSTSRTSRPTSPASTAAVSPSPLFFNRSPNGRFTPEDRNRNGSTSPTPDPVDSPVLGRRRPLSPLSGPVFQPMASVSSSRPGTPSNITWNAPSSPNGTRTHGRNGSTSVSGRSRSGSFASVGDSPTDLDPSRSSARSLRSPALPDSPWVDMGHASTTSLTNNEPRPPSAMSSMDLGSPIQMSNRSIRSPTPTYGAAHSPTSPTFTEHSPYTNGNAANGVNGSRRSSRQNAHSSFSLGPSHALLLSPIGNSSRSSLESAGSSYHSWDEDHRKDRLFDLFSHLDAEHTEWHEFPLDKSGSSTSKTTPPVESQDSEEVVRRQMGLSKYDMIAIQDKLVSAALTKAATPEGRHRANSLRKRRPSTSQSNYSVNGGESRVATPAQQPLQLQVSVASTSATSSRAANSGQIALLDAVVDSIQSPRNKPVNIPNVEEPSKPETAPLSEPKISTPSMRQRALADVLFGTESREVSTASMLVPEIVTPPVESDSTDHKQAVKADVPQQEQIEDTQQDIRDVLEAIAPSPPSLPPSTLGHVDATLLALDVQRRAEAATAALRKSPSIPKIAEAGSTRKKISPSQISSPKLLSASTSVDTIPLPSPHQTNNASTTKIGSRFKKLRGTLRAKTHVPADEVTPYPLGLRTPPSSQTATYNPASFAPGGPQAVTSAMELSRPRISPPVVPSPPASAGPGKRGFMSLFRKQRHAGHADAPPSAERRGTPLSPPQIIPASIPRRVPSPPPPPSQSQSAPAEQSQFLALRPLSPQSPLSAAFPSSEAIPEDAVVPPLSAPVTQNDEAALKQLFDAASNLGLDQAALNDLIARSPSISSRATTWTKLTRSTSVADSRQSTRPDPRESVSTQSPLPSEGRPSVEAPSPRPSADIRQLTIRKNLESTPALRPQPATTDPLRAIVRRTIIVPSDSKVSALDLNALIRKQSSTRRRRSAGAASNNSNRSIQDRAPTPPPPRSIGSRRFSTDKSPPVPQLPHSFSSPLDSASPAQVEQSNSTYDSLYEMYANDNRVTGNPNPDGVETGVSQHPMDEDSGPAVEVIELANGETIWSIVNGLRDDDAESFYDNRRSFASDYSGEGVKVLFKEHGRKSSKGSNVSFLSRKKQLAASSSNRPETKVFFSSSAQIGRLIENLSRDLDAGSFNITPDHAHSHTAHSVSSSVGSAADMRWTLEERLEHMLGSMSASP